MLLVWGDLCKRGRVWCYIVREMCEYHSRGEEYIVYMVLFWSDMWFTSTYGMYYLWTDGGGW